MESFRSSKFIPVMLDASREKSSSADRDRSGPLNVGLAVEIMLMVTLLVFFTVVLAMV